jgi:CO/xanthine dehydrogenase FAD-binding subunit
MVGSAARPIDDHRATAVYRRHAIRTLAGRALQRLL